MIYKTEKINVKKWVRKIFDIKCEWEKIFGSRLRRGVGIYPEIKSQI
jgi:hypothetical protein